MIDFNSYIKQSRKDCEQVYKLDPATIPVLNVELSKQEVQERKESLENALHVIQHFMQKVIYYMDGTPTLVVTSDNEGHVIEIYGDPSIMEMVDSLGIIPGVKFDEAQVGTNSISMALKHEEAIALVGPDHFQHCLHGVACYTAPFSYSEDNRLSGTVSIMTLVEYANNFHLGLLSSAVDSIERELLLQEKNKKLKLLNQVMINSTPLGIVMTDQHGAIKEYNASLEKITELDMKRLMAEGKKRICFIGEYIKEVLSSGEKIENVEITIPVIHQNREKICLLDVLPLFDGESIIGTFAQFRDMTNYYELQQQLIESEKLSTLGRFGAGLAHEIRNPLTSIIGLTQLLKENNHQNKYLEIITDELERMESLVNQFVLLGKPNDIHKAGCDINKLIYNTVELMKSNAQLQDVKIHFIPSQEEINLEIDQAKIKQVLINFIKNAFEAMPEGGNIYIQAKGEGINEKVTITIEDEGVGMTQEEIDSLGTPFFTSKENGLGMGLPICFDIVKAHDGEITVESEKGKGTVMQLQL